MMRIFRFLCMSTNTFPNTVLFQSKTNWYKFHQFKIIGGHKYSLGKNQCYEYIFTSSHIESDQKWPDNQQKLEDFFENWTLFKEMDININWWNLSAKVFLHKVVFMLRVNNNRNE